MARKKLDLGDIAGSPQEWREARAKIASLTRRERDVLAGVVRGLENPEIGKTLGISPRTVDGHRVNIRAKLGEKTGGGVARLGIYAALAEAIPREPRPPSLAARRNPGSAIYVRADFKENRNELEAARRRLDKLDPLGAQPDESSR